MNGWHQKQEGHWRFASAPLVSCSKNYFFFAFFFAFFLAAIVKLL